MAASEQYTTSIAIKTLRNFGRAAGGAVVFSLPMLMTMEFWGEGVKFSSARLLLLVVFSLPVLVLLSQYIGFERTNCWFDDIFDTVVAIGISAVICILVLMLFGVLEVGMPIYEWGTRVSVQLVPASLGALLARSQFSSKPITSDVKTEFEPYGREMFFMLIGAIFLGLNIAPTDDLLLIAFQITPLQVLLLLLASILAMHSFVFSVDFRGGTSLSHKGNGWSSFVRLTLPGYIIALAISFCFLWLFHRTDSLNFTVAIYATIVLAFPCSIGAAAARLIL